MWKKRKDGSAINEKTGEEFYTDYRDGLYRVYRDAKVVASFRSGAAAADYIDRQVSKLEKIDREAEE